MVLPGPPRELHAMWPQAVETRCLPGRRRAAAPTTSSRSCACSASRSRRSPRRCAWPRVRSPGSSELEITTCLRRGGGRGGRCAGSPLREPAWRALLELVSERHGHTLFSTDGSRVDEQVVALLRRPLAGRGGVVHRRPDGRAADRAAGLVGLLRGWRGGLLERGQGGAAGRRPGADRAPRRGVARGGRRRWPTARSSASRRRWRSRSPGWRVRAAAPRPSPWATCAGARSWPTARMLARDVRLPGDRAEIRDRSTTVAMHLLRRLLRGEEHSRLSGPRAPHVRRARPARRRRGGSWRAGGTSSSPGAATCGRWRRRHCM